MLDEERGVRTLLQPQLPQLDDVIDTELNDQSFHVFYEDEDEEEDDRTVIWLREQYGNFVANCHLQFEYHLPNMHKCTMSCGWCDDDENAVDSLQLQNNGRRKILLNCKRF